MVHVECTCIVNLNNTDFYVFSYSATEKTKKGFGEFSCYTNLLCFIFIFLAVCSRGFALVRALKCNSTSGGRTTHIGHKWPGEIKECMLVGECSKTYQATSVNLLHFLLGQVQYVFNLYGFL